MRRIFRNRFLLSLLWIIAATTITVTMMALKTTAPNMSYLTPEIIDKQELVDSFNTALHVLVGLTFAVGVWASILSSQLDDLKTVQMAELWESHAESEKEIAVLNNETANLNLEYQKLKLSIQPRVLRVDKMSEARRHFTMLLGSDKFDIWTSPLADTETKNFAAQIQAFFNDADWHPRRITDMLDSQGQHRPRIEPGLTVVTGDRDPNLVTATKELVTAMRVLGFETRVEHNELWSDCLTLIIGPKEQP